MRLEIGTERGMRTELSFYIHLHASMGSTAAAGWSRQREVAAAQHGDSFGGNINGLQSRAGQQRSHPYDKAVLAARASSPPAVQGFDDMKSSADAGALERFPPVFDKNSGEVSACF